MTDSVSLPRENVAKRVLVQESLPSRVTLCVGVTVGGGVWVSDRSSVGEYVAERLLVRLETVRVTESVGVVLAESTGVAVADRDAAAVAFVRDTVNDVETLSDDDVVIVTACVSVCCDSDVVLDWVCAFVRVCGERVRVGLLVSVGSMVRVGEACWDKELVSSMLLDRVSVLEFVSEREGSDVPDCVSVTDWEGRETVTSSDWVPVCPTVAALAVTVRLTECDVLERLMRDGVADLVAERRSVSVKDTECVLVGRFVRVGGPVRVPVFDLAFDTVGDRLSVCSDDLETDGESVGEAVDDRWGE